ncbi:MAG: hypothetical protein Q9175_006737, partial [Cornicularia normoerica]
MRDPLAVAELRSCREVKDQRVKHTTGSSTAPETRVPLASRCRLCSFLHEASKTSFVLRANGPPSPPQASKLKLSPASSTKIPADHLPAGGARNPSDGSRFLDAAAGEECVFVIRGGACM